MQNITKEELVVNTLKKVIKYQITCPICKEKQTIGVEIGFLKSVQEFPFSHIHIHGRPIHALILYIDKQFMNRGIEGCDSIEVNKDGGTFQEILKKWSNPF